MQLKHDFRGVRLLLGPTIGLQQNTTIISLVRYLTVINILYIIHGTTGRPIICHAILFSKRGNETRPNKYSRVYGYTLFMLAHVASNT